jgi:uncharacterized protein YjbI with pentapeptide repeats
MLEYQKNIRPSILQIRCGSGRGTGFWVKGRDGKPYILTCTHILTQNEMIEVRTSGLNNAFDQISTAQIVAQIPVKEGDITLLELADNEIPENIVILQLLDTHFPEPQLFLSFGFPDAFPEHGRPTNGTIVATATSNDRLSLLQLNTEIDIKQGFSGGPVVHAQMDYYVLGMISEGENSKSKDIPYALTAKVISEKLNEYLDVQTLHPYKIWLASSYHDLVLNDEKGMRLSDIYVPANCGIHQSCIDKETHCHYGENPKNGFVATETNIQTYVEEALLGIKSSKYNVENPLLTLLLGYPGQGKTSFTKRLIHDFTINYPDKEIYLVRLRYITDTRALLNNPFEVLKAEIIRDAQSKTADMRVNFDNSILILDGLDELSIKSDLKSRDIDDIVSELNRNAQRHTGLHILLTSRYGYTSLERLANKNILILQISELQPFQQSEWLTSFRNFHPESHLTEQKLEIYHTEAKYQALRELIAQPILLQMVASLEEDLSDAVNRSAIYEKLFDQLIKRGWDKGGNIATLKGLDTESLRHALQDMAHAIYHSEKGYLYRSALDKLPKVKELGEALDNKIEIWRSVMVAFYIGEVRKGDRRENEDDKSYDYALEFIHKSLYEYLCAEKIWRDIKDGFNIKPRKAEHAIDYLWDIFRNKVISVEITQYLIEIIQNDDYPRKRFLYENLVYYLNDLVSCNFLSRDVVIFQLDSIQSTFYGYWTIISHLKEGAEYFQKEMLLQIIPFITFVSQRARGPYFNLSKADLSGINLSYSNFSGANLFGANLSYTNLFGANLSDANLSGANLSKAILSKADFSGANLSGANLSGANLLWALLIDANLAGANLADANFIFTRMGAANLNQANLTGANLTQAELIRANLENAVIVGACLIKVNLFRSSLVNANLKNAILDRVNMTDTDLTNANLARTRLTNAMLMGVILNSANLEKANLLNSNLIGAKLESAILNNANLKGTILKGANLKNAAMIKANLRGASLLKADLTQADLTQADLTQVNLTQANLTQANLTQANLTKADLSHATLTGAILDSAKLKYSNLSFAVVFDSKMNGANMTGVHLERAKMARVNLENANLENAKMARVNLKDANLSGANLRGTDLSYATMENTNMTSTSLVRTTMVKANLKSANLSSANLSSSIITNANLEDANLEKTNIKDIISLSIVQLQSVKNLHQIENIASDVESSLRETHPHLFETHTED